MILASFIIIVHSDNVNNKKKIVGIFTRLLYVSIEI